MFCFKDVMRVSIFEGQIPNRSYWRLKFHSHYARHDAVRCEAARKNSWNTDMSKVCSHHERRGAMRENKADSHYERNGTARCGGARYLLFTLQASFYTEAGISDPHVRRSSAFSERFKHKWPRTSPRMMWLCLTYTTCFIFFPMPRAGCGKDIYYALI